MGELSFSFRVSYIFRKDTAREKGFMASSLAASAASDEDDSSLVERVAEKEMRRIPRMEVRRRDEEVWQLWSERPMIGIENEAHASGLRGCAFSDLEFLEEPVYVQEVYIMDNFMRALAEFRSPQSLEQASVPVPCCEDESLASVKRRLFEQVRHNFVVLQDVSSKTKDALYGKRNGTIRSYSWIDSVFGEAWTENELKWYVYQDYESFLDPDMWNFYGPDMETLLFEETLVSRVKDQIQKFKKHLNLTKSHDGLAKASSIDAVYLLPTHIRVMLWREGYHHLMYTLPRETTFESLKIIVESDLAASSHDENSSPPPFTKFDCGPPENKFGPGKCLGDVFPPTTVGVSHTWA